MFYNPHQENRIMYLPTKLLLKTSLFFVLVFKYLSEYKNYIQISTLVIRPIVLRHGKLNIRLIYHREEERVRKKRLSIHFVLVLERLLCWFLPFLNYVLGRNFL